MRIHPIHETIVVNHKLQRFYNYHIKNSIYEKTLSFLVYCAIGFIVLYVFMYFNPIEPLKSYLKYFVPFVYIILGLELLKEAAIAKSYKHFMIKHWIDLCVLSILSTSMLFITYIGLIKIPFYELAKFGLEETKHYRAVKSLFNKKE